MTIKRRKVLSLLTSMTFAILLYSYSAKISHAYILPMFHNQDSLEIAEAVNKEILYLSSDKNENRVKVSEYRKVFEEGIGHFARNNPEYDIIFYANTVRPLTPIHYTLQETMDSLSKLKLTSEQYDVLLRGFFMRESNMSILSKMPNVKMCFAHGEVDNKNGKYASFLSYAKNARYVHRADLPEELDVKPQISQSFYFAYKNNNCDDMLWAFILEDNQLNSDSQDGWKLSRPDMYNKSNPSIMKQAIKKCKLVNNYVCHNPMARKSV